MDLDTLIDFGDFFDEETGGDILSDAFGGPSFEDEIFQAAQGEGAPEIIQQEQEMRPLPEYKPEEYQAPEATQQEIQELRQQADIRRREGGEEGFKEWWGKLPDKQKETLFRATMGSIGMGAQAALQNIQQRRSQEFQQEMQERQYQEREKERREAEEARRVAGTPSAYQFNVSPRGIINQGMGR